MPLTPKTDFAAQGDPDVTNFGLGFNEESTPCIYFSIHVGSSDAKYHFK